MVEQSIEFLTVKEVQEILDLSAVTLHKWRCIPGIGPAWVEVERRFFYPSEPFRIYLRALTGGQPVPKGLNTREKKTLFRALHTAPSSRELAVRVAALTERLATLEAQMAVITAEPKKRRIKRLKPVKYPRLHPPVKTPRKGSD